MIPDVIFLKKYLFLNKGLPFSFIINLILLFFIFHKQLSQFVVIKLINNSILKLLFYITKPERKKIKIFKLNNQLTQYKNKINNQI
jgi:hypothetical protein